jgi:hypothetical protein
MRLAYRLFERAGDRWAARWRLRTSPICSPPLLVGRALLGAGSLGGAVGELRRAAELAREVGATGMLALAAVALDQALILTGGCAAQPRPGRGRHRGGGDRGRERRPGRAPGRTRHRGGGRLRPRRRAMAAAGQHNLAGAGSFAPSGGDRSCRQSAPGRQAGLPGRQPPRPDQDPSPQPPGHPRANPG